MRPGRPRVVTPLIIADGKVGSALIEDYIFIAQSRGVAKDSPFFLLLVQKLDCVKAGPSLILNSRSGLRRGVHKKVLDWVGLITYFSSHLTFRL